jgi:phosphatidylinositol alpha-mannosyltransferase
MLAVLRSPAPVVATFHANMGHEHWQGRFFTATAPLLRAVWRKLVRRIAVSRAARRSVRRRFATGAITIVPNGTDTAHFASGIAPLSLPAGRKLLFVGRLESRKGFPVALGAFEALALEHADLQLLVVGGGPERDSVDSMPAALRSRIHMLGRVSDSELPDYHAAADIFLAPATGGESFGIVLVEAMAAGLPVVGSDIQGYRDVARDGKEALLVPPSDAEALADGVRRVLHDDALSQSLGSQGRIRARLFDWGAIVERLEKIYVEARTEFDDGVDGNGERGTGS